MVYFSPNDGYFIINVCFIFNQYYCCRVVIVFLYS